MGKYILFLVLIFCFSVSLYSQSTQDFSSAIKQGDFYFTQNKFLDAKNAYENALKLNPNDSYAKKQVEKCVLNEKEKGKTEENRSYQKIINKADQLFDSKDYTASKGMFQRALELKPSDEYPKKQIEIIDALLNPKKIDKRDTLPTLGLSSDLSLEDAEKQLKLAEFKRRNKKDSVVVGRVKLVQTKETSIFNNSTLGIDSTKTRLGIIDKDYDTSLVRYGVSNSKNNLVYTVSKETKMSDSIFNSLLIKDAQIERNQTIVDSVYIQKEHKIIDDTKVKQKIQEFVAESNVKTDQIIDDKLQQKSKSNTYLYEKTVDYIDKIESDDQISLKKSSNKNDSLHVKSLTNIEFNDSIHTNPEDKRLVNKQFLHTEENSTEVFKDSISGIVRIKAVNQIDGKSKTVQNHEESIIQDQNNILQETDRGVSKSKNITDITLIKTIEKQDSSVNRLKNNEKKHEATNERFIEKEVKDNLSSKSSINGLEHKTEIASTSIDDLPFQNSNSIDHLEHSIHGTDANESDKQVNKNLTIRAELENIESKVVTFDDKISNTIGASYPEGVSQESFNKTDDEGLLLSVITRRIVVKNGYGQVYTRIQKHDSITYQKNGEPSTEMIWQRETQDAKLKKNFK
jgi:epidermal growth factor receptor substrate 15